jgi:hypothetical protein
MFEIKRHSFGVILVGLAMLFAAPGWAQEKEAVRLEQLLFQLKQKIEAQGGHYSIGLAAEPEEKGGLLVKGVLPGSPAAKAGLKEGDVITKLNRAPLDKVEDLRTAIAESKGEALHLQITREGQAKGITVTPDKRGGLLQIVEEEEKEARAPTKPNQPRPNQPGAPAGGGWMQIPGQPGAPGSAQGGIVRGLSMMAGGAAPHAALPDDMEVTISKKGNKPAVIKVTQGVKTWKTDETELGMLPQPAQAYVARHLGKLQSPLGMMMPAPHPGSTPQIGAPQGSAPQGGPPVQFRLKLDEQGKAEPKPSSISPKVKQLPGGGLQIEIREEGEKEKPQANPAPKKDESSKGAAPRVKVIPGGVQVEIGEE